MSRINAGVRGLVRLFAVFFALAGNPSCLNFLETRILLTHLNPCLNHLYLEH